MCQCQSCEYTDSFHGWKWDEQAQKQIPAVHDGRGGFDTWPRGEPAGSVASARAYAAHQRACPPIAKPWVFVPPKNDKPPITDYQGPRMPQWWYEWNERTAAALATAGPARPGKAEQHFPALDRQREAAVIYAMPKPEAKDKPKRSVGRPAIDGRRVVIKLEERHIESARKLASDGKNISEGIRKALGEKL
jgi:hypothetical protein